MTPDLLAEAVNAHGGLARWSDLAVLRARASLGGTIWDMKIAPNLLTEVTVSLFPRHQLVEIAPFLEARAVARWTPGEVSIDSAGRQAADRCALPRSPVPDSDPDRRWDRTEVAEYLATGLWRLLTRPFWLAASGAEARAIDPSRDEYRALRRFAVRDTARPGPPPDTDDVYYLDEDGLIRRHDFEPARIALGRVAICSESYERVHGLMIATRHRAYLLDARARRLLRPVLAWVDLADVTAY